MSPRSPLSARALAVGESATLAVADKAAKMKASGLDVVTFGAGEPDFETPDHIKRAAIEALAKGYTRYTPSSGIPQLRAAAAEMFRRELGVSYDPAQVLVSCGAKHSIYNVMHALLDPGDEAIIPAPYWTSYPEMVKTAGGVPKVLPTPESGGFKLTPALLEAAIGPKTRLLVHCSPTNPTGVVYTRKEVEALAEVVVRRGLRVVSDEVYAKMVYGGAKHVSIASVSKEAAAGTVVVTSCSKTYAMTGWRVGFAAGPLDVIEGAGRIQGQATSNPSSVSQYAALAALEGDQGCVAAMVAEYARRRDYIVGRLKRIKGFTLVEPSGAFYAFPNVSSYYGRSHQGRPVTDSTTFCSALLEDALTAFVPGAAFGDDRHVRISYATTMENLATGLDRLEKFLGELS